jgi:O-antigen/teichoic acid export membrane protein
MLFTFVSRLATAAVNFGTIILLSRKLGPEGKGIATLILVIVTSVQLICDFMGGAAMVYLSPRYRLKNLLFPAWTWTAAWSLLAPLVVWWIRPDLFEFYGWHIAGLSFLNASMNQQLHLLNGREQFKLVNILNFLTAILTVSTLAAYIWWNPKPIHYMYALYSGWLPAWIISLVLLLRLPKVGENLSFKKSLQALLKFSSANQFGHMLQFSNQRIAYFLLPAFALGIYSNAVSLAEAMWMLATSIATIQYGTIANSNDKAKAIELTVPLFRASILVTTAAGLFICLLPASVFGLLFGDAFLPVKENLYFLMPGVVFISGYLILGHYFSGTGQFMKNNYAISAGLLVTLIGFVFLAATQKLGINEHQAALVTTFANMATFFSVIWLFKSDSGVALRELLPRFSDLGLLIQKLRSKVR